MHKVQGNIAEAKALLHFTEMGYCISKPVFENTPYDFVIDNGCKLYRVQVKSSRCLEGPSYRLELRTKGGAGNAQEVKRADSSNCDLLFATTPEASYIIPVEVFDGKGRIMLGDRYKEYMVR
ncbi:hypothetical protein KoPa4_00168 [Pseudomonas phage vB_PpuM-KoPa-4]|uniref:PD(D/E)XK endonuclease domain-containing protein n=1 Tax=Pseudomonas phage vB_PpuM-KoPa-4 TaxID=3132618 RepID=A0AAX4MY49_9CAUD